VGPALPAVFGGPVEQEREKGIYLTAKERLGGPRAKDGGSVDLMKDRTKLVGGKNERTELLKASCAQQTVCGVGGAVRGDRAEGEGSVGGGGRSAVMNGSGKQGGGGKRRQGDKNYEAE